MPRGWRLSLLSVIPFSLLLLPPTTARKARDRNEVSEREIKFSRSRLRRITHKIGRRFWERMPQLLFVSLDHVVTHAWSARSPPAPSPRLKGEAVLISVLLGVVRDDNAANVSAAYPTSSYQLSRGENRFQSGVIGFRRSGAGGYVLGPTGIAFLVMNGQLELG